MMRRFVAVLLLLVLGAGIATPAAARPATQIPNIYVDPDRGSMSDPFVFGGVGFVAGTPLTVSFTAPDGEPWELVENPLVVGEDGTFRLPIIPVLDLAIVPGRAVTVQLGRWIARFTLPDESYIEHAIEVLP